VSFCFDLPGLRSFILRVLAHFVSLLVTCVGPALSQISSPEFDRLSVEHGLSFNQVNTIMQDSRGFMWFGTFGGLNRYDGYEFRVYTPIPGDTNSIPVGLSNTLYEDANGDIWANGVAQLARYDRFADRFVRYPKITAVTAMTEECGDGSRTGRMWFATNGNGLHCYEEMTKTVSTYRHDQNDGLGNDSLTSLLVDRNGVLWIGSASGLVSFDAARRHFSYLSGGPETRVWALYEDPDTSAGILWLGAEDGLYAYDRMTGTFAKYRSGYGDRSNDVRTIFCDRKGRLWVGTKDGVLRFDRSARRFVRHEVAIAANFWADHKTWTLVEPKRGMLYLCGNGTPLHVFDEAVDRWRVVDTRSDHELSFITIFEDRTGTLWFGTWSDGVLKLDPAKKQFTMYKRVPREPASMSSSLAAGISQDASGSIWVGTHAGLNKYDPGTGRFTHYRHDGRNPESLAHDVIWPVLEEDERYLWIGTIGGGLDKFDRITGTFQHFLNGETVTCLYRDRSGTLWVGASPGTLFEYVRSSHSFRRHVPNYKKGFGSWEVQAIVEDHDGLVWIGVIGQGVISFDRKSGRWGRQYSWDPISPNWRNELGSLGIHALHVDRDGTLWIGSARGLYKFNKSLGTFTGYAREKKISGILEDDHGYLWISTMQGISKFDPRSETFRNYDVADGVDIGSWSGPTGYRSRTGEMFFGGSGGLLRFHPDSIRDNRTIPSIVITGFAKFNNPAQLDSAVSEKKQIEISHADNMITFTFAALGYTSPTKNHYAYKLEGFDKEWIECGATRTATYTNLDGGKYVFRAKGSNEDGLWNEDGASISLVVTPPFWATAWFKTTMIAGMVLTVGGTIRSLEKRKLKKRIEQLELDRALEKERTRISQDMHDEVGSSLSEIAILSEMGKKCPEEALARMEEISERAATVIESLSDIVWAMNPRYDTLDNLIAHIRGYSVKYLHLAGIRCSFHAPDGVLAGRMTAETRRNLLLVVKESLHNIVKHASASEVSIGISLTDAGMKILIEDNGKGFKVGEQHPVGNGLDNMARRMAGIGAVFNVHSQDGRGTRIAIEVPLRDSTSRELPNSAY
jgi:ligand-binding sensor domain-containing protein/signal transduction histidine kinase